MAQLLVRELDEDVRRSELLHHILSVQDAFGGRTLPLTASVMEDYAVNVALLRRHGLSISLNDAYIAATAVTHGAVLYTRNLKDFQGHPGLEVVSPWPQSRAGAPEG